MNYLLKIQISMNKHFSGLFIIAALLSTLSCSNPVQPNMALELDPKLRQVVFKTPEEAAEIFALAVKNNDQALFDKLLGADFRKILPLDDVTIEDLDNFDNGWNNHHSLLAQGNNKMLLTIGESKWTMPIPIVLGEPGWYFDVAEGVERMRIRRIGRNELATMQAVLAYYDAQMEYAEQDRNGNHKLEYAQKFISTPGKHDGLYWQTEQNETPSPLGILFADRAPHGGYHGYYYRILTAQGKNAIGGTYSYLIANNLRAGFALIAWPEEYGESGIMSFIVSHSGIVYEQNLGVDSADIALKMSSFDPAPEWVATQEANSPSENTAE